MFTGIVDDVGIIERAERTDAGVTLRVRTSYDGLAAGESMALNGACLTVIEHGPGWFTVAAAGPTLERTSIGSWMAGRRVNLERALRAGDRMGGHIVQGHVDGVATVSVVEQTADRWLVDLLIPENLADLMVLHGSIAVDGVSLTVNALPGHATVQLSLIHYTRAATTLGELRTGDRVHVEADIIGKYVQRLVAPHLHQEIR